ncbi:MAG: peroxidase [Chloroflexota bacterium]
MTHHRRGLRRLLKDDELATRLEHDFEAAGISPKRLAMLRYALKLTATPGQMERTDVESLRREGFSDTDILHIAEVVSYFAYANRIADGLGVPLEDWIPEE